MTAHQKQGLSWLEWRSAQTGRSIEELRQELKERAAAGGRAHKGRKLSEEHKKKLSEAYWRRQNVQD